MEDHQGVVLREAEKEDEGRGGERKGQCGGEKRKVGVRGEEWGKAGEEIRDEVEVHGQGEGGWKRGGRHHTQCTHS